MPQSPYKTDNLHTGDNRIRQVDDSIEVMSWQTVPLLKLFGTDNEVGTADKYEWVEDELLAETSTVKTGGIDNSSTSLNLPSGEAIHFQSKEVIRIESEYLYVTGVNTSTDVLTVVRGIAGSTAASHAAGVEVSIVGLANAEMADAPESATKSPIMPYNRWQDFDTGYKISFKMQHTKAYGVGEGADAREFNRAMKQTWIKLERAVIYGVRRDPETVNSVAIPSLMGGLDYFLSQSYSTRHYEKDLATEKVTEKAIADMLQSRWEAVGPDNMARTLLVNAFNKRAINDLYAPYVRTERETRRGGVIVDVIDTDFGPVDIVPVNRVPKSVIYLVKPEWIKVCSYEGLAFADYDLAVTGAFRSREIYGSYSLECKNVKAMGVIRNTAVA